MCVRHSRKQTYFYTGMMRIMISASLNWAHSSDQVYVNKLSRSTGVTPDELNKDTFDNNASIDLL